MKIPNMFQPVFAKAMNRILGDAENQYIIQDVRKSQGFQRDLEKSTKADPSPVLNMSQFWDLFGGHVFDRHAMYAQSKDKHYKVFGDDRSRQFTNAFLRLVGKLEPCEAIKQRRWGLILSICNVISTEESKIGLRVRNVYPSKKTDKGKYEDLLVQLWRDTFYPTYSDQPSIGNFFGQWHKDWFDLGRFVAGKTYVGNNYNAKLQMVHAFDSDLVRRIVPGMQLDRSYLTTDVKDFAEAGLMERDPFEDRYRFIVYNKELESIYKTDETMFYEFLRRPSTDTNHILRGCGVVESGLMMMEAFRESIRFNKINLSESRNLHEVLFPILKSNQPAFGARKIEELVNLVHAHMTGITGKGNILISGQELGKLDLTPPNMEMQMEKWVTILCTFICALAEEDPNDIGLPSLRGSVEKGSMIHNENKIAELLDRNPGLKSFMADATYQLNNYTVTYENGKSKRGLIEEMTGEKDLYFDIVADVPDMQFKQDMIRERLSTHSTIREVRESEDMKIDPVLEKALTVKLEDGDLCLLDVPALENPQVANAVMQVLQMNMPQPEMEAGGVPGAEGGGDVENPDDQMVMPGLDEQLEKSLRDVRLVEWVE